MSVLLVAYPDLSAGDAQRLAAFRDVHDMAYKDIVGIHFTLVFPIADVPQNNFVTHVQRVSLGIRPIRFVCRCATVAPDNGSDDWFVFLVPDEGHSEMVRLHDQLYTGVLAEHLLLDIPFIPHIAVATSKDRYECKRLADMLNKERFEIVGAIRKLTVASFDGRKVTDIERLQLQPPVP